MSRLSIRLRVALAFSAAMAVVLAAVGAFLFIRTRDSLDGAITAAMRTRATDLAALIDERAARGDAFTGLPDPLFQLVAPDGRIVAASPAEGGAPLLPADAARDATRRPVTLERDEAVRLLAQPVEVGERPYVLVVGASLAQRERTLETLGTALAIGGPIAVLLAALAGYILATFALRPVDRMRSTAEEISLADSSTRLPLPPADDEIHRLASTLNAMLDRLHAAAAHERAFIADASHELRTPLARIRTELDLATRHARTSAELRDALDSVSDEADHLIRLANDLLVLSRLDEGIPLHRSTIDVDTLLDDAAHRHRTTAALAGREIRVGRPADLTIYADPDRLAQALDNLVENALRYGDGPISLSADDHGTHVAIHVHDAGRGIDPAFAPRAFDRFSRDAPATAHTGAGLGLAIVRAIARAHGGDASIAPSQPHGTDATITVEQRTKPI